MHKLFLSCLIFTSFSSPVLSLPVFDSSEVSYQLPDSRAKLDELSSLERTYLLQNVPAFLDKQNLGGEADEFLSKEGLGLSSYNPRESVKEAFYGKHPRTSALSFLLSKDRKQYKKRGEKASDCFWKYCV
ncbi:urotensin-2 [Microcaecilia unicolor]|uniref:Urotensin-2 n=1 Tax=Microcaecilia unicolor TaxID=1415580 RepID=A0A6P7WMU3_9AMPH|nr:urotensin-2 [Microcaecilia unicolor]